MLRGLALLTLILLSLSAPAHGESRSATLAIRAVVTGGCEVVGGSLDFGSYTSGQTAALDAGGVIGYTGCTGDLVLEIDGGRSGDQTDRRLGNNAGSGLRYQLYRNNVRTQVWGTGSMRRTLSLPTTQSGTVAIFGRIFANQIAPIGSYSDTVNVTLTF